MRSRLYALCVSMILISWAIVPAFITQSQAIAAPDSQLQSQNFSTTNRMLAPAPAVSQLRVLSWNIAFGKGTDAVTNYDRTGRWIALLNPDVVTICEMPSDKISVLIGSVTQRSGVAWVSHFVPKFNGTTEGNLILSKHGIVSTSSRFLSFGRSVAQATINFGGRNINVFATHLDPDSSSARNQQVGELAGWSSGFAAPRIVGGDFNAGPDLSEIARMTGSYADSWADAMNIGTAVAYPDNPVGVHTRTRRGRIDYVFYTRSSDLVLRRAQIPDSRDLANTNVQVRLGTADDLGVRPSDHNHMVADFDFNSATPGPTPTPTPIPTPTPTPTPSSEPAFLQFSSGSFSVNEGGLSADITVTRTGNTSVTSRVKYATSDGSAQKRGDYIFATGILTFAPGQTSQSFRLLMVDDVYMEGSETLSLTLSNPSNASLGSPSTAVFTIVDNDFASPTFNPIDRAQFFVRQQYLDFLNRQPDTGGLNFWVNEITSCGSNAQCLELKRINVSAAFFLAIEFQETGVLACLTNKAAFNALPGNTQFEFDRQGLQRNFAFGAPGSGAQLEANKQAYFAEVVSRASFVTRYGGMGNTQYVDTLISNTGVAFSTSERSALINGLNGGTETRATVLRKIAEKPSFKQAQFNRIFVLMEYFGYLKRDADTAGLDFWLSKLNTFGGNFINAEMVKAYLTAIEYRRRFSSL